MAQSTRMSLFGGDKPWSPLDWTSSDDRVRGGSSISHLSTNPSLPTAKFHGTLDIKTLGGAGFASQRTRNHDETPLNLSAWDGITLSIARSDGKRYTLTIKDEIPALRPDAREQSGISWEHEFEVPRGQGGVVVRVPWEEFRATFRGRDVEGEVAPLKTGEIRRFGLMMRSFFGTQEGPFELVLTSIEAFASEEVRSYRDDPKSTTLMPRDEEKVLGHVRALKKQGWVDWAFGGCGIL